MAVRGGKSEFRTFIALAGILGVMLAAPTARAQCTGDCNDSGNVSIDELVLGVNISLGTAELSRCEAFDCEGNQMVPVNCLIQGVNNSLNGCGGPSCALPAGTYTITQAAGGVLTVGTLSNIPFPAGGTLVLDVGPATLPDCIHNVVLPMPGGFQSPAFCIPAFGFTVSLEQSGCGVGRIASAGGGDFTITEVGDTSSQPECNNQQECTVGTDSKVRVDITVGDQTPDTCDNGTANMVISVPVVTTSWVDMTMPAMCPSADGMYNPGVDQLILQVNQILDFTTDTNTSSWMDLSGDGCPIAGSGPAVGFSNRGTCWHIVGGTVVLAASGTVGSDALPLYDFSFTTLLPNTIEQTGASTGATCASPPAINFDGTAVRCLE
jgi:hypothetical protein